MINQKLFAEPAMFTGEK